MKPLAIAIAIALSGASSAEPILTSIDGAPYSVELAQGRCAEVFPGCSLSSFAFHTEADARAATQVILDLGLGRGEARWGNDLILVTPYDLYFPPVEESLDPENPPGVLAVWGRDDEPWGRIGYRLKDNVVEIAAWAVWTPVPVPSTLLLLGLGLVALARRVGA